MRRPDGSTTPGRRPAIAPSAATFLHAPGRLDVMTRNPAEDIEREASLHRARDREAARERAEGGRPLWETQTGIQAAVAAVRDLQFPLSREDIVERAGAREVQVAKDALLPLAAILTKVKEDTFLSPADFERAVQRHWEGVRFLLVPPGERPRDARGR